ncbi:MAG: flavodoxin family protein [Eubacteriales bacterium]|nr:flavodoxin family protein [Eubacteriales bacterium]
MSTMVVYASATGNTKKVASAIFAAIPDSEKDMQDILQWDHRSAADTFFVGFWNNRGSCPLEIINLLSELHGRRIALFGTCGLGRDAAYYRSIEQNVKVWIPDDNEYLGCFLCQGKMPMSVRSRYESMRTDQTASRIDHMVHNFDEALLHPDETDLANARAFVKKVLAEHPAEEFAARTDSR